MNTDPVQNRKHGRRRSKRSCKCVQFGETMPQRETADNHCKENLVSRRVLYVGKDRETMNSTAFSTSPEYMLLLLVTHNYHLSRSNLAVSNQSGAIPAVVGSTKPINGPTHLGDDSKKIWDSLHLWLLPEAECVRAERDEKE